MRMPDVNILIYAHRSDEVRHPFYKTWLQQLVEGPQPFALSSLVAIAFVRIVTHPRFGAHPTPLAHAISVIESLRAAPGCRLLSPGARHVDLTLDLCRRSQAQGKRVADAQHSALALEHGCTWVSADADFAVFQDQGLDWLHLTS